MRTISTPFANIAFSEFIDGDLSFYNQTEEEYVSNWKRLEIVKQSDLPLPCWVNQIHGKEIVVSDGNAKNKLANADGIITKVPNNPIGIFTADCTPIILFGSNFAAAVHSGWRGTKQNIASSAVNKLKSEFGVHPNEIMAVIGPCINQCCLELGEEVYVEFIAENKEYEKFFVRREKPHLDMRGLIRYQLVNAGVNDALIMDINECTYCNVGGYFSYRRQKQRNGTMFSFVVLKKH